MAPRVTLSKLTARDAYGDYSVANCADLPMTAANTVDKNQFAASGKDLVVAYNSGASEHTVTITSEPDPYGRSKDIAAYALQAGEIAVFGPLATEGWMQADKKVYLEANHAEVKFGVIALP